MSWYPRPVGPRAAFADLRAFLRQRSKEQFIAAGLSLLVTGIIVFEFFIDSKINTAPPPRIIYVEDWRSDRTDEEIIARQAEEKKARDEAIAERQRQFQKLEKRLGID